MFGLVSYCFVWLVDVLAGFNFQCLKVTYVDIRSFLRISFIYEEESFLLRRCGREGIDLFEEHLSYIFHRKLTIKTHSGQAI